MPHPTVPVAVRHPETSEYVALNPAIDYADDDIFVKTYPWAFAQKAKPRATAVSVEQASAAPGEKRSRSRAK